MKTATFDNTVSILVQAYLNDTLENSNCYACAVGNLVAEANQIKFRSMIDKCGYGRRVAWTGFYSVYEYGFDGLHTVENQPGNWMSVLPANGNKNLHNYQGLTKQFIDNTGYSVDELQRIEIAFEYPHYETGDIMFDGLMSVLDVLANIHGIDLTAKEEAKKLFVKI
jgi:hypothetical protein